jgi:hypothetical protein
MPETDPASMWTHNAHSLDTRVAVQLQFFLQARTYLKNPQRSLSKPGCTRFVFEISIRVCGWFSPMAMFSYLIKEVARGVSPDSVDAGRLRHAWIS